MRAALLLLLGGALFGAPPQVMKVEPPNWWAGHSINPVRLLISGSGLGGARVRSALKTSELRVNSAGTHLFVDIFVPPGAKQGPVPIQVITSDGEAKADFRIAEKLPATGRFQGFSPDDVIYLIMPDRFANGDRSNDTGADLNNIRRYHGGDLQGIIQKLPYLGELGVTAIWLNPVYNNQDHDYHGYHGVDFYAVEDRFGDLAKFRELVDAAHRHGIRVIQDQVANHTGPRHPWVANPPTPTWFHPHIANTWQTWTLIDPYASAATRRATLDGWFVNRLPDLNQSDAEVRRYLIQNALWWIGMTGLDGIRQDTLPYVPREFWREWNAAIRREYPDVRVVGEVLDRDPVLVSSYQHDVDTVFDFPLYFAIRRVFHEGKPLRELPAALAHDGLYKDPMMLVTLLGVHDVPRFANPESIRLAFTFLMTTRGIPLIYYGDEIAMQGGGDPDNRRDFPDPASWTPEQKAVFEYVRKLTRLRAENVHLRRGKLQNLLTEEQQYVYSRGGQVVIAINNDSKPANVTFELDRDAETDDVLGSGVRLVAKNGRATVQLPARSAAIFSLNRPR